MNSSSRKFYTVFMFLCLIIFLLISTCEPLGIFESGGCREISQTWEKNNDEAPNVTAVKCLEEAEDQGTEEGSTSETGNDPTIQLIVDLKQKGIKLSVGDITTSVPNVRESRYEDQRFIDFFTQYLLTFGMFKKKSAAESSLNSRFLSQLCNRFMGAKDKTARYVEEPSLLVFGSAWHANYLGQHNKLQIDLN
ncbi:hypothetical protein QL285_041917 [Trifolium repens]|nr:hypothetical protein QL285_041917 [Trifolium repens]